MAKRKKTDDLDAKKLAIWAAMIALADHLLTALERHFDWLFK
jgi:hypothetical protein